MSSRRGALVSRAGQLALSQAANSASNTLVALAVAQSAGVRLFAWYSVGVSVFLLIQGTVRASILDFFLLPAFSRYKQVRPGLATLTRLGALGTMSLPLTWAIGPLAFTVTLAGLGIIAALCHDYFRYLRITDGRYSLILRADVAWMIIAAAGLGVAVVHNGSSDHSVSALQVQLGFWCCGALAGTSILQAGTHWRRPARTRSETPPRERRVRFVVEFLVFTGLFQLTTIVVAPFTTAEDLAGYRFAALALGPFSIIVLGARQPLQIHLARAHTTSRVHVIVDLAAALLMASLALLVSLLVAEPEILGFVGGDVGQRAGSFLPGVGLVVAGSTMTTIGVAGLRARTAESRSQGRRAMLSIAGLVAFPVVTSISSLEAGTYVLGAAGMASGLLVYIAYLQCRALPADPGDDSCTRSLNPHSSQKDHN